MEDSLYQAELYPVTGGEGLEPSTYGFGIHCSTN